MNNRPSHKSGAIGEHLRYRFTKSLGAACHAALTPKENNDGKGSRVLGLFSKSTIDTYDTAFIKCKQHNADEEETDTYA